VNFTGCFASVTSFVASATPDVSALVVPDDPLLPHAAKPTASVALAQINAGTIRCLLIHSTMCTPIMRRMA